MSNKDIIKNCDIIMVGQQPWDTEIGSNSKNLALEFSRHNRVLYVNSPLDRRTSIKFQSEPAVKKRIDVVNKKADGINLVQPSLWVYNPDEIIESINWISSKSTYTFLNKLNNKRFARSIQKAVKQLGFKNFILFNDNDIFRSFYLKELLKPVTSIYYSRDYLLTIEYWKIHGTLLEPQLIAKSDLCLANSVYLANYCKQYNKNSYYVGQGCDVDIFVNYKGDVPEEMAPIKGPVLGYVGALQHIRLDIDLIKYIALQLPEYNIVLVGPEDNEFKASDLHDIKNVFFLGNKPIDIMPAYIKAFDVCLNPQSLNEVTIGNYPRKIDEYLAMGKPVVATQTEAMDTFKERVYLCNTYADHVHSIKKALAEDSPQLQHQRVQFAKTHTWENNVKNIYKIILEAGHKPLQQENLPIFILSNIRYNSFIEATSMFLARELAANRRVYYIAYPLTYKDYFTEKRSKAFDEIKRGSFNADKAVTGMETKNLKKIDLPFIMPLNFLPEGILYRKMLKFNENIIIKRLKHVLKKESIKNFIYMNAFNFHFPGIGNALKPDLKIYSCLDPMITPYDLKHGAVSELQLVEESDMVFCSSKALYEEKSKINKNTWLIPNAGELSHSSKALNKALPLHKKLKDIPRPIIGYIGTIERRIDYDLMKSVAAANTDKSFVFVGPVNHDYVPGWFFNIPNLYLTGQLPYEELPQMLKGFDIAIIPFKKDKVSSTIFPLKLFEYLGAGKPVVLTNFNPDLRDYTDGVVDFCNDAKTFTEALNGILNNDYNAAEQQAKRLEIARQNTWEIRALQIMEIMNEALGLKEEKDTII